MRLKVSSIALRVRLVALKTSFEGKLTAVENDVKELYCMAKDLQDKQPKVTPKVSP